MPKIKEELEQMLMKAILARVVNQLRKECAEKIDRKSKDLITYEIDINKGAKRINKVAKEMQLIATTYNEIEQTPFKELLEMDILKFDAVPFNTAAWDVIYRILRQADEGEDKELL